MTNIILLILFFVSIKGVFTVRERNINALSDEEYEVVICIVSGNFGTLVAGRL